MCCAYFLVVQHYEAGLDAVPGWLLFCVQATTMPAPSMGSGGMAACVTGLLTHRSPPLQVPCAVRDRGHAAARERPDCVPPAAAPHA